MQDSHLLGKDAIRMSSIHTARLNPDNLGFCISSAGKPVFIPVLVDNANVAGLRYSFTPLVLGDGGYSHTEHVYLTAKRLKAIDRLYTEDLALRSDGSPHSAVRTPHYRKGTLVHVQVSRTGTLRLERVLYPPNIDAHIVSPLEIAIPPCPHAEFAAVVPSGVDFRCLGHESESRLFVEVYGVPPLTLKWSKFTDGKREHFVVREIKYDDANEPKLRRARGYQGQNPGVPREIRISLEVSSITPGDHLYVLDELIDAVGNVIYMDVELVSTDMTPSTKTIHSFTVLHRPTASFSNCSPETPTYIRRGFASSLTVSANTTENPSPSWEVKLRYQPSFDVDNGGSRGMELFPWERTFTNQGHEKDIRIPGIAFGDYTIVMVKGKVGQ
jgi:nucleoporin POM152